MVAMFELDFKDLPPKAKEAARKMMAIHYGLSPQEDLTYIVPVDRWIFYIKYNGLLTDEIELELMPYVYGTL